MIHLIFKFSHLKITFWDKEKIKKSKIHQYKVVKINYLLIEHIFEGK